MDSFNHTGTIRTRVESRGVFGVFGNKLYSVDIFGDRLVSEKLPFFAQPRSGWKGSIRHLRLHLTNITLKGLPVLRFEADIPDVTYDIGQATYKDWLVIRGAGVGPASVMIAPIGLETFVSSKYSKLMSGVKVVFLSDSVGISGNLGLFGKPSPFSATGRLATRAGRYLDLIDPQMMMNGKPLSPAMTNSILKQINPVLDIDADLGLGGYFTLSSLEYASDALTVRGIAGIPLRATSKSKSIEAGKVANASADKNSEVMKKELPKSGVHEQSDRDLQEEQDR